MIDRPVYIDMMCVTAQKDAIMTWQYAPKLAFSTATYNHFSSHTFRRYYMQVNWDAAHYGSHYLLTEAGEGYSTNSLGEFFNVSMPLVSTKDDISKYLFLSEKRSRDQS